MCIQTDPKKPHDFEVNVFTVVAPKLYYFVIFADLFDPLLFRLLRLLNSAMRPAVSSLNPYAASYIPLSRREAYDRTEPTTKDYKNVNEAAWYAHAMNVTQNQHHSKVSLDSVAPGAEKVPTHPVHGSYGSLSSKQMTDEEFDMDLEYLHMSFPDLSDQSLTDVYLANKGDLEATIDMLNQLEFDTFEISENLPHSLDIGDVSESGSSSECASLKLKNVVGEASSSSSGSSGAAIVS